MRVLVYAVGIYRGGGPVNHLRRFLTTLSSVETDHQWVFIVNAEFGLPDGLQPGIAIRPIGIRGPFDRLYYDLWRSRSLVREANPDVLLNLADFGPLPRDVPVVTFQRNPNYYDTALLQLRTGQNRVYWELRRRWAHRMVRRSDRVLCPSETMADMVATTVGVDRQRVRALHHPFNVGTDVPWAPTQPPRLLYVGHLMPHKNHEWLLRVFAASGLAKCGARLCMTAAREDWPTGYESLVKVVEREGLADAVQLLGRVSPDDIPELYRTATLFVFASLGESFGFPLVEALSSSTPTLALDTRIAREICGAGARYLPADIDSAGAMLKAAATADRAELERWSRAARVQAARFCISWTEWLRRLEGELEAAHDQRS
jgi:glycosyltransferase involved in cell wall biosynthesis